MIKIIVIIVLLNALIKNTINAAYADHKCFICNKGCDHPGDDDAKSCSDSGEEGTSGKEFVKGALGYVGENNPYDSLATELTKFGTDVANINATIMPSWESLTRWVCYVSKDKRRGCLAMSKGLCQADRSWLSQITDVGDKLTSILEKAKKSVTTLFGDVPNSSSLTEDQKSNISDWMAKDYMGKLIKNGKADQYTLNTCCDGNKCNFASMIEKSTIVFVVLLLSTFILV